MNTRMIVPALALLLATSVTNAQLINDSFNYQGALSDRGAPANGVYDVKFTVYDDEVGGFAIRDGIVTVLNVQVTDGLFEAYVDFGVSGTIFDSTRIRWLELEVKPSSNHLFETLAPRQRITPAPLANYALRADHADSADFAVTSGTTLHDAYFNGSTITTDATPVRIRGEAGSDGDLELGGGVSDGELSIFNFKNSRTHRMDVDPISDGGQLKLFDADQNTIFEIEPDNSFRGGGLMTIGRNATDNGFLLDGNYLGTESPRVYITGEERAMLFDMSISGNNSVILPSSAISTFEMANETGIAEGTSISSGSLTNDGSTIDTVGSVTIDAPSTGYILVFATAEVSILHFQGTNSSVKMGLSQNTISFPSFGDHQTFINFNAGSGLYDHTVTTHSVFSAAPGSNTFYLLAKQVHVGGSSIIRNKQISAVFIPTSYGNIGRQAGHETNGAPMTNNDIIMEQNAAIIANNQRLEREMEAMKAQMQQILKESEQITSQQSQE